MKNTFSVFLLLLLFSIAPLFASQSQPIINVNQLGLTPNSGVSCTQVLQSIIDEISQNGGGVLSFPKGIYTTGCFELKTGVKIHLQKGAILQGSTNPYDYTFNLSENEKVSPNAKDNSMLALIVANDATDIAIYGKGTIDGRGRELALNIDSLHHIGEVVDPKYNYKRMRPNETARPKLIRFSHSSNIQLSGVTLCNSACWGVTLELCSNVRIKNLTIENRAYWNNDGIDITDCRDVQITHCDIDAADDGICLKSYYKGFRNDSIYIADCRICSSASAIKFGTASHGGFHDVEIENIYVYDTYRSAIAIETVDGGNLENITVRNIKAKNTGNALFIRLGHRSGETPGTLRNIHIDGLAVEVPFGRPDLNYDMRGPALPFFHNPIPASITGIPGAKVENVVIENINIVYPGRSSKGMAYVPLSRLEQVPEQIKSYPEYTMFGELPSWAFYVRHVNDITFRNITLKLKADDYRPAFVFDDVNEIILDNVKLSRKESKRNWLIMKDSQKKQPINTPSYSPR